MAQRVPISPRKQMVFRAIFALLLFLLAEGACRVIDRLLPESRASVAVASSSTQVAWNEYQSAEYAYEPFSLWRHGEFAGEHVRFDGEGRRHTHNPSLDRREGRTIRIAFFGGSTMAGLGADDRHTLPSIVSRELSEKYPRARIEAVNFGVGAYVSSQEMLLFWRRIFLEPEPWDLAVFYDGANEGWVSFWHTPGGHNYTARIASRMSFRDEEKSLREVVDGVARELASQDALCVLKLPARIVRKMTDPGAPSNPRGDWTPEERIEKAARVYRANQRLLETMCTERDISALYFLQPVASLCPGVDDEKLREFRAFSSREHFRELYRQIRSLEGSPVEDLSSVLDGAGETFLDWCHLSGDGNEIVARSMLPSIERALRQKGLLAGRD